MRIHELRLVTSRLAAVAHGHQPIVVILSHRGVRDGLLLWCGALEGNLDCPVICSARRLNLKVSVSWMGATVGHCARSVSQSVGWSVDAGSTSGSFSQPVDSGPLAGHHMPWPHTRAMSTRTQRAQTYKAPGDALILGNGDALRTHEMVTFSREGSREAVPTDAELVIDTDSSGSM